MSRIPTMLQLREDLLAVKKTVPGSAPRHGISSSIAAVATIIFAAAIWIIMEFVGGASEPGPSNVGGDTFTQDAKSARYEPRYHKSYAILIGINYQGNPDIGDLSKPEADVLLLQTDLDELGFSTIVLTGKSASRQRIRRELHALQSKLQVDDQVLIYFAGHGEVHSYATGTGFLLPFEADRRKNNQGSALNWIRFSEVSVYLKEYRAKHVLLALDCCHSGSVFDRNRSPGSDPPALQEARALGTAHLTRQAKVIMVSCMRDQKAPDHSVFARAFHEKLQAARTAAVSHLEIAVWVTKLGARGNYQQVPSARNMHGTDAEFLFMPPGTPRRAN